MNFLGHFYLSHHDEDLLVGNFIADFVKGKKYLNYPPKIAEGIMMHRNIDQFTDSHAITRLGKKRLFPTHRHYAGVIMDMYYDHFLAKFWTQYHPEALPLFSAKVFDVLESCWQVLPEKSQQMLPYMKSGQWLTRYATLSGLGRSLSGMAKRLNNHSKLEFATVQLEEHYEAYGVEAGIFLADVAAEFG
jgi:acyl carrier protein phosphodiesterase